eukprot:m.207255 g.207255  ORF g.207255 m.207255 type:complete len:872 (-) comp25389_c0_seq1:248-2863(-)
MAVLTMGARALATESVPAQPCCRCCRKTLLQVLLLLPAWPGAGARSATSAVWHGPEGLVGNTTTGSGRAEILVDGQPLAPVWFVGAGGWAAQDSTGGRRTDLGDFFSQVGAAAQNGFRLFEPAAITGNSTTGVLSESTRQIMDGVIALRPDALFILRLRLNPDIGEPVVVQCKDNASVQVNVTYSTSHIPTLSTPASDAWLPAALAQVVPLVRAADAAYPSRIVGVHLGGMESMEWDWPGAYSDLDGLPNSTECGSTRAFGNELTDNYYADYSPAMRMAFCSSPQNRQPDQVPCELPSAAERDTPRTGNAFVCGASSDPAAVRAVAMNQLQAQVMANAIAGLGRALKQLSEGKLLVLAYYGYTLSNSMQRPGSVSHNLVNYGHLAAHSLLSNPAIDGFTSPYYYSDLTRIPSAPLLPSGQYSSLTHHGKLWIVEDDTRTSLFNGSAFRSCAAGDLQCTLDLLRRNIYTTAINQHGMYLFDLDNMGWFGQAAHPSVTSAIWKAAGDATKNVAQLNLGADEPLPAPQIAVFFDEMAPKTQPLDSRNRLVPRSSSSSSYSPPQRQHKQQTAAGAWMLAASSRELAVIGAPVRRYYLADLPSLSAEELKPLRLAIFLNAFAPSNAVRQAMRERLPAHVSLLFLGPAGLVVVNQSVCVTNLSAVSDFIGIPGLRAGTTDEAPMTLITAAAAKAAAPFMPEIGLLANVSFGSEMPFSPLMHWEQGEYEQVNVQVLGRYTHSNLPSLVTAEVGTSAEGTAPRRVFFSGAPSLPAALIRSIARGAGVHVYTECREANTVITLAHGAQHNCDDVAAQGGGLMIHAGNRTGSREVWLPAAVRVVDEYGGKLCELPCTAFNVTLRAGESRLLFVSSAAGAIH